MDPKWTQNGYRCFHNETKMKTDGPKKDLKWFQSGLKIDSKQTKTIQTLLIMDKKTKLKVKKVRVPIKTKS